MPAPAAARPSLREPHSVGFNLAAIAIVLTLGGLALAYAIDTLGRASREPPHRARAEATIVRAIGGKELTIPLSWFRYAEPPATGFAKQIDLSLTLPLGKDGAASTIELTLLPRSGVHPSARLLDGVYLHMFEAGELSGVPGLVGKPLKAAEGYEGEVVWYDPLSPAPFVAKCDAPVAEGGQSRCLRAVHLGPGIAAVYAFDAEVLPNWRSFDSIVEPLLREIGALEP